MGGFIIFICMFVAAMIGVSYGWCKYRKSIDKKCKLGSDEGFF